MKTDIKYFRVKNYEKFQHYVDRNPPWIKLYNTILDDYEFAQLDDSSKAHLMLIWALASRHQNSLRMDSRWIRKQIGANSNVNLTKLIGLGFLIEINDGDMDYASRLLASRKHVARPEKETEKEEEKEIEGEAEKSKIKQSATASGAGTKVKKTRSKKDPDLTKFQAWKIWIDIHRELGKTDPVAMGPDTAASSRLGAMVTTGKLEGEELKNIMMAYLRDTTPYVSGPGHPLSLLPKRINAYRNNIKADSKPITTPEQDAERARVRAILKAQEEREASERESDHD